MKLLFTILISAFINVVACKSPGLKDQNQSSTNQENESIYTKPQEVLTDFKTWYNYTYFNIHLAQDFIALDTNAANIDKLQFLDKLITGKFLAIKEGLKDSLPVYKLFNFAGNDADIISTSIQIAAHERSNYQMEGRKIPDFEFTGLDGKTYSKSTTRGKLLILKCWFIHCVACVREFPQLNKLADEYKQDSDILFVSLAIDSEKALIPFLKTNPLNYAVIPNAEKYMMQSLDVNEYPTHIVVDQYFNIQKVVNDADDLTAFLNKRKAAIHK